MTRTLRTRLILSQVLPLVIVVPLLFFAFSYLIETRFLVPRLAQELLTNARLLAEIVRVDYITTGDQRSLQLYLLELQPDPHVRLVYLNPNGEVLFTNDPAFLEFSGEKVTTAGLKRAQSGEAVVLTRRSAPIGGKYSIDVLLPVKDQQYKIHWDTMADLYRNIAIPSLPGDALAGSLCNSGQYRDWWFDRFSSRNPDWQTGSKGDKCDPQPSPQRTQ